MISTTGTNYHQISGFNYGWICPKCGSVYSPTQTECYKCSPVTKYEVTSTSIAMDDYEKIEGGKTNHAK